MAKGVKRKVRFLHSIKVLYLFPLTEIVAQESKNADTLLNSALEVAERIGCEAIAAVVQALCRSRHRRRSQGPSLYSYLSRFCMFQESETQRDGQSCLACAGQCSV
jgi:hypothetical protein